MVRSATCRSSSTASTNAVVNWTSVGASAACPCWCRSNGLNGFAGKIAAEQLAAAELYGELMARNRGVMGLPRIHPHSAAGLMLDEGIFGRNTNVHEPEFVERVRRRAAAAILMVRTSDGDAPASMGRKPSALVHVVACYDTDAAAWSRADLRNLCHGLDALCRLFRVHRDSS